MKTKSMIWIVSLAIALSVPLTFGQTSGASGALSLVNVGIYPQPITSGSNVTITFQLYNSYSNDLNNVNLQLTAQNPLINVSPTYTFLINAIGTGLFGGIGYNSFKYTFHVPSTTPSGEYTIDVLATYETTQTEGTSSTSAPAESVMPISFYVYGMPNIGISASPAQIVPGQDFELTSIVENGGSGPSQNVNITIHNSTYFTPVGPMTFDLGNIQAGGMSQFSAMLLASQYIRNGTYPINATIMYTAQSGAIIEKNESIMLNVVVERPNIVVTLENALPQNLYPGGNQTLQIAIQNTGMGLARNVSVSFYNTSAIGLGSVSSFYISELPAGSAQTEQIFVSAHKGLNQSTYSLPVAIKYVSANYQNSTINLAYMPITLQSSAAFNVTAEYGTLTPGATYVPLTFTVKNTGNEQAQQVSFSLQTVYPITPVTPNAYIGSIAPGQQANVTFYVSIDQQSKGGSYPVTLYEQWTQPNGSANQAFSSSENYFAMVEKGTGQGSTDAVEAIVIIVVIAAIWIFARSRKKAGTKQKK